MVAAASPKVATVANLCESYVRIILENDYCKTAATSTISVSPLAADWL